MALAATLILSTFTMADTAYGLLAHELHHGVINTNEGDFTCTAPEGSCGIGTTKAKFRLLVTEVDETLGVSTGVSQGQIRIIPDIGEQIILENSRPLEFTYDLDDRVLEMTGKFEHSDGLKFTYDARGNIIPQKDNKAKIVFDEFNLKEVDASSFKFEIEGLKGNLTLQSEGFNIGNWQITEKGDALVHTDENTHKAKVSSQFNIEITEITEDGVAIGSAQGEISIMGDFPSNTIILDPLDPLPFRLDSGGEYSISGPMVDQFGTNYEYDGLGRISDIKNGKAKTDSRVFLEGDERFIEALVHGGIIFVPIGGR